MDQRLEIQIPSGSPKTRLEDFLFASCPGLSRMYLRGIVRDEKCEVNGRLENVGYRLRSGDFLELELDLTRENSMRPENVPLEIVYEDEHLVVVNKPAGMLVHPTNRDKNGTLLNALVFHFNGASLPNAERGMRKAGFGTSAVDTLTKFPELDSPASSPGIDKSIPSPRDDQSNSAFPVQHSAFIRPGLVHRLDKQTSGLIVIAKSVRVHRSLARQFQRKFVEKKYLALVDGVVEKDNGSIVASIGRFAEEKRWDVKEGGKPSETRFQVIERRSDSTLLELEPVTGRTNQLRIHCASIGHPIVGDVPRGGREFARLCLHAWKLSFRHPFTREDMEFESTCFF
ncbi:MAG: RluA family pseudouridine synthase [Pyrinomonadaceae bacterium]